MKHLCALATLILAGCASGNQSLPKPATQPDLSPRVSPTVSPVTLPLLKASHVQSPVHPQVVVIGDSIVNAWLPTPPVGWAVLGTPDGVTEETSAEVSARFPQAVALDPDVIVLEVGTWDVDFMDFTIDGNVCDDPGASCQNITNMVNMAEAAGIPIILGTMPPWGNGPLAEQINPQNPVDTLNHLNQFILHYGGGLPGIQPTNPPAAPYPAGVYVVDYHAFLAIPGENGQSDDFADSDGDIYVASYTNDGVNPNSVGAQIMTQVTVTALSEVVK